MSLLVFAAIASAAAGVALTTRHWRRVGTVVAFAGLLVALVAALAVEVGDRFETAGSAIEVTAYGRLFLLVGLVTASLVLVAARLTAWQRNGPIAVLGGAVSLALALATPDVAIGLLAVGGAALVATLVALVAPLTPWRVRVLAREVRGAAASLILALIAISLVPGSGQGVPAGRVVTGIALVVAAMTAGHRLASVPFHTRSSRLAEAAPTLGLPLLLAWIPAAWAVVLLDWAAAAIAPAAAGLGLERGLVVAVAVATLALGTVAALVQDEIEKIAAYAVVASGGLVILAFAALDGPARDGLRTWLPAFVAFAAGLAGWTIAIRGAFGTGRVRELAGWIRSAPVLAAALVAFGVAAMGWPGAGTWEARVAVLSGIAGDRAPFLAFLVGLLPGLILVRLVMVGAARPGPAAIAAASERPRWGVAVLGPGSWSAYRASSPTASDTAVAREPVATGGGSRPRAGGDAAPPAESVTEGHPTDESAAGLADDPADAAGEGTLVMEGPLAEPLPAGLAEGVPSGDESRAGGGATQPAEPAEDPCAESEPRWRGRAGLASGAHRVRGRRLALPTLRPIAPGRGFGPAPGGRRMTAAGYLLDANRTPIRAAVVFVLAVTTLLAAAGAFGLREAAAEAAPRPVPAAISSQP